MEQELLDMAVNLTEYLCVRQRPLTKKTYDALVNTIEKRDCKKLVELFRAAAALRVSTPYWNRMASDWADYAEAVLAMETAAVAA